MKQSLRRRLLLLTPVVIFAAYLLRWGYMKLADKFVGKCSLYLLTGFYCPGCGNTRAVNALMSGKILTSIGYNPMPALLLGVAVVHYIWTLRGKKPPMSGIFVITVTSVLLLYYILRNFIPLSPFLPPR